MLSDKASNYPLYACMSVPAHPPPSPHPPPPPPTALPPISSSCIVTALHLQTFISKASKVGLKIVPLVVSGCATSLLQRFNIQLRVTARHHQNTVQQSWLGRTILISRWRRWSQIAPVYKSHAGGRTMSTGWIGSKSSDCNRKKTNCQRKSSLFPALCTWKPRRAPSWR